MLREKKKIKYLMTEVQYLDPEDLEQSKSDG